MPAIKYVFLPLLCLLFPYLGITSITEWIEDKTTYLPSNLNKQPHLSALTAVSATRTSIQAILPPLPWQQPASLSFISLQEKAAQQKAQQLSDSPIKSIIEYHAEDSITFDNETKNFNIYGAGTIAYGDAKLTADNISLNWGSSNVIATGKRNEEGKIDPKPVFEQGKIQYIAEEIRYNFKSKRGTARKLFVKQDEIIVRAKKAKMDVENTYYANPMKLTGCNLKHPHYFLKARELKFVKDKRVTSGPFNFYFDGVPTILGFFYGIFYFPKPKVSGIIRPRIGEEGDKGFYLKEGGYYFYFNDYIDLAIKGSIYSSGHSSFSMDSNYKKRYSYIGRLNYAREITSLTQEMDLKNSNEKQWRLQWHHNTENNRVSSLVAEVDIQGRSNSQKKRLKTKEDANRLNAQTNSKIRYSRKLGSYYNLNTSLSHSQDFLTNITKLTFPQMMLSSVPIYPLKSRGKIAKSWYENIYVKHISEFQTNLTNVVHQDTLEFFSREHFSKFIKESKYGFKHTFPVEMNIKIFNYFNLKPTFQFTERWYYKTLNYRYDATAKDPIQADTLSGFKRIWDHQTGATISTTIYGTHFFDENAKVQAMRHRIEPAVSLLYNPDFSKPSYEYWQKISTPNGEKLLDKYKLYEGLYGTPKNKASALMNFKVDNILEIKVQDSQNANGKPKKIPILESLNASTSYDFLADSFPLGDIQIGFRNRYLDSLIVVEYNTTLEPYFYKNRRKIEEFAWQHGKGLGTMKKYSLKISTSLKSKNVRDDNESLAELDKEVQLAKGNALLDTPQKRKKKKEVVLDPDQYIDFDVPWQLNLSYQQNYTYQIEIDKKETIRQLLFEGGLNLTHNWKITFSSTYDFDKKELVGSATKLGIHRDLHCWQMSFDWSPLASKQTYEFAIGLKTPILQDLKYQHERTYDKL